MALIMANFPLLRLRGRGIKGEGALKKELITIMFF